MKKQKNVQRGNHLTPKGQLGKETIVNGLNSFDPVSQGYGLGVETITEAKARKAKADRAWERGFQFAEKQNARMKIEWEAQEAQRKARRKSNKWARDGE